MKKNQVIKVTDCQYANGRSARTDVAANDKMTTSEVITAVKTLRNNSGRTFNGYYIAVIHPDVEADLLRDPTFVEATRYAAAERLYKGEVARYYGAIFVRAESIDTYSSTVTVYPTWFIAQFSYAITDLQDLRVFHHPPGSAGTADPLNQLRTLGWKVSFKAAILNNGPKFVAPIGNDGVENPFLLTWTLRREQGASRSYLRAA
jgi:N4-gp56 family major capsid protein